MIIIKKCPFCGFSAKAHRHYFASDDSATYGIVCQKCGSETRQFYKSEADAIEAWNHRVSETTVIQNGENNTHIDNVGTLNM